MRRLAPGLAAQQWGLFGAVTAHPAMRSMNMNPSTTARMQNDQQEFLQQSTQYDFDKEQLAKQMKFATMDCILNPDITPLKFTTWSGLKKWWKRYVTMKKLVERMPEFDMDLLKDLFKSYKRLSNTKSFDDLKLLQRVTTHGETARITKEVNRELNQSFQKQSWKAIKAKKFETEYEVEVDDLDVIATYMVNMADDDWVQLTTRCDYRERKTAKDEWTKVSEFPVFEVRLADTMKGKTNGKFIVVGVMKKDGTRYGRDAQDAAQLRKNFEKASKWF